MTSYLNYGNTVRDFYRTNSSSTPTKEPEYDFVHWIDCQGKLVQGTLQEISIYIEEVLELRIDSKKYVHKNKVRFAVSYFDDTIEDFIDEDDIWATLGRVENISDILVRR